MPKERDSCPRRGDTAPRRGLFWNVVGVLFTWTIAMALWQKGFTGYLGAFVLMYAAVALIGAAVLTTHVMRRYAWPICAWSLLAAWWSLGGTYSWWRDAMLGSAVVLAVLLVSPASRLWLRRLPRRLRARARLRRRRRRREASADVAAERARAAQRVDAALRRGARSVLETVRSGGANGARRRLRAAPVERTPLRPGLSARLITVGAMAVWLTLGVADRLFESRPLPRNGTVTHPPGMAPSHAPLRVGLALSGGGYRAALVHAGVVDALGQLGVPVTHLSSVSGGSIIGSYLAVGGAPRDFLAAVAEGRFRMTRDLMSARNIVRLPSPAVVPGLGVDLWPFFGDFSRIDVQADLIDRVLLDGATPQARRGPRLMVCMTDLNHGLSVGATDDGVLLAGPTVARYFRSGQAIELPALQRLADRVAVSGAFPGAFPTLPVQARIARTPEPASLAREGIALDLQLADGGVRDNLGLSLLEAMDRLARDPVGEPGGSSWIGFRPDADWQLDVILVSDGGKFVQSEVPSGVLGTTMRAIDLSGLATGILRPMGTDPKRPRVVLSALSMIALSPDSAVLGMNMSALRDAHHAYFRPDMLDDVVVDKILALQPEPGRLRAAWRGYRQGASGLPDPARLERRCRANSGFGADPHCGWWTVVSEVGEDIWRTTEAFARTPTLTDSYTVEQAETIYRFGQYLVFLRAPELRRALEQAVQQQR